MICTTISVNKNEFCLEDDAWAADDEFPPRNCKKLWTERHLAAWTDAAGVFRYIDSFFGYRDLSY